LKEQESTIKDWQRTSRTKSAANVNKSLEMMQIFVENPHSILRKHRRMINAMVHSSYFSTWKMVHSSYFSTWKMQKLKSLTSTEDDFDRRIEFCDEMMRQVNDDNIFFDHMIFSDEAFFYWMALNWHTCRYWNDENLYWTNDFRIQYFQKLFANEIL